MSVEVSSPAPILNSFTFIYKFWGEAIVGQITLSASSGISVALIRGTVFEVYLKGKSKSSLYKQIKSQDSKLLLLLLFIYKADFIVILVPNN